ncbi:uncharacterized protein ARMOST_12749 [Armillaria ostoyae]|uniref:Uncharacterized protein n=1 Tax=Armillaria ostoyae TaxID=47428 RepID=A0A284RKV2_ARMOS|nr:uncharacterized protein ARMOST_12749 [Armillaria ostoyae]
MCNDFIAVKDIFNLADGFDPYNYDRQRRIYGRTSCDWESTVFFVDKKA